MPLDEYALIQLGLRIGAALGVFLVGRWLARRARAALKIVFMLFQPFRVAMCTCMAVVRQRLTRANRWLFRRQLRHHSVMRRGNAAQSAGLKGLVVHQLAESE